MLFAENVAIGVPEAGCRENNESRTTKSSTPTEEYGNVAKGVNSGSKRGNNRLKSGEMRLDVSPEPNLGVGCPTGWYAGDDNEGERKVKRSQSTSIYIGGIRQLYSRLAPGSFNFNFNSILIHIGSGGV